VRSRRSPTSYTRPLPPGATTHDEHGPRPLAPSGIAVGVTHRDQRARVAAAVDEVCAAHGLPAGSVVVDTARTAAGPAVRARHRVAPALRQARRQRVPPGGRPSLRPAEQAPPRVRRRHPRRAPAAAGGAPVDRPRLARRAASRCRRLSAHLSLLDHLDRHAIDAA
jgi:hypothetical protein